MSAAEQLKQGVYRQGEQVIVILPSDKVVLVEEIKAQPPLTPSTQTSTLQSAENTQSQLPTFLNQDFDINQTWSNFKQCWKNFDDQAAIQMTQFKRHYVLPVGEIPVRTVCMAVSTGLVYAVLGRRNSNFFGRARNLAISFVANGVFWLPESFNPFLFRQNKL